MKSLFRMICWQIFKQNVIFYESIRTLEQESNKKEIAALKLRNEHLMSENLNKQNENQLLDNRLKNMKQNFRLELREREMSIRKIEDDFSWRRGTEQKNSEALIKKIDLFQLENLDLKRDIDSLRVMIEQKDDRVNSLMLDSRKLQRLLDEAQAGRIILLEIPFCIIILF